MVVLLLLACTSSGTTAEYSLQLEPVFPDNQSPFDLAEQIRLTLVDSSGDVGEGYLESVPGSGESSSVKEMPPLDDTTIYLDALGQSDVLAWGRSRPLTASTGSVEAPIFVAKTETFGWLGGLDVALADTEMIALGDGRFLIAGGAYPNDSATATHADGNLYEIDIPESDALPVFTAVGSLPAWSDGSGHTERIGANFLHITEPGTGDDYGFLIGGGTYAFDTSGSEAESTYSANLYNFATGVWDEVPIDSKDQLQHPRQYASATVDARGQVVVVGGWDGDATQWIVVDSIEVYVPNERKFYSVGSVPEGSPTFAIGIAPIGDDGTLFCGGGVLVSGKTWQASDACGRVATSRAQSEEEPLSSAVADPAMVALSDGRVVAIGGAVTAGEVDIGDDAGLATETVQEYDSVTRTWTIHPGALNYARVGARAVEVSESKVLVFGGAATYDPIDGYADPMPCAELLDTDTFTSTSLSACDQTADSGDLPEATAAPLFAVDPEYGVLVAGGRSNTGGRDGTPSSAASLYLYPREP